MTLYTEHLNRLGRNAESDECYTPEDSVKHLVPYLPQGKTWYEACSGKSSQMLGGFRDNGLDIIGSHDKDFFECEPDDVYDGVITNPPYSKKDQFIEKCYSLGKPFALLLPVAAFQGQKRGNLFLDKGISALVYNRRVDFTGGNSPTFGVAWFMFGMPCGEGRLFFVNN